MEKAKKFISANYPHLLKIITICRINFVMSLENSQLKNLEVSSDSSTENGANDHNSNSLVKTEAVNTTSQPLEEEQNDNPEVETKENSQKSTVTNRRKN